MLIPTAYFLWERNYKNILKIWGFTLGVWYLIFTTSLSGTMILIGFENTEIIINYMLNNNVIFENLCFQTVYMLGLLSVKVGFPLYILAMINIFSFFKKDKPQCPNEENSNTSSSWWNKSTRKARVRSL